MLTIVCCALFVTAGFWQLDRARQKIERLKTLDDANRAAPEVLRTRIDNADALAWRKVAVEGVFIDAGTVLVDNKVSRGVAGYHVVTPLRPAASMRTVLINRGWVEAPRDRAKPPPVLAPTGRVRVEGIATQPPTKVFELGTPNTAELVWPNLTLERYAQAKEIALEPILVLQTNDLGDGLRKEWDLPGSGADKNRSYAFQWFTFAALAVALYVGFSLKRISQ